MVCIFIVLQTIPNKITRGVIVIYLLAFIVFLSSRIIIITTLLSLLIMAPQKKVLIGAVVVMIALIFLNPVSFYRNLQEYTLSNFRFPPSSYNNNPISIRTSLLWLGVEAVRETNPLFGAGTGDVKDTIAALADKYNIHNVLNTSDPHNQYLHTYIALGAIGLLTLLAAFITPLWMFFRLRDFALCAGMLAFMIVCLTESALELQKGIVFFSLAVSLAGNQMRGWSFSTKQLKYA
jgi:O-antigen ligase